VLEELFKGLTNIDSVIWFEGDVESVEQLCFQVMLSSECFLQTAALIEVIEIEES